LSYGIIPLPVKVGDSIVFTQVAHEDASIFLARTCLNNPEPLCAVHFWVGLKA
jgi:hypothetical protein